MINLFFVSDENKNLIIDESRNEFNEEQQQLIQVLSKEKGNTNQEDLNAKKEKLKRNLSQQIEKITNFDQYEAFIKILAPLEPTMAALEKKNEIVLPTPINKHIPHNKSIDKQRRLFSTRKKIKKPNSYLNKPTAQEADVTAVQLLNV